MIVFVVVLQSEELITQNIRRNTYNSLDLCRLYKTIIFLISQIINEGRHFLFTVSVSEITLPTEEYIIVIIRIFNGKKCNPSNMQSKTLQRSITIIYRCTILRTNK